MTTDEQILICAVRYCLTRQSYVVADCCYWLRNRWAGLSRSAREVITRDIDEALVPRLGGRGQLSGIDQHSWSEVYTWILEQK